MNPSTYSCETCGKTFLLQRNLIVHACVLSGDNNNNNNKPHRCSVCGKSFASSNGVKSHLATHSFQVNTLLFECTVCRKKVAQWSDHIKTHTQQELCGELQSKIKQHKFKCEICDKNFTQKVYLKKHSRIHSSNTSYKCEFCERPFRSRSYVKMHMKVHTGETPYQCQMCTKTFAMNCNLKAHMRTNHAPSRTHECETCGNTFRTARALKKHVRGHTQTAIQMDVVQLFATSEQECENIPAFEPWHLTHN